MYEMKSTTSGSGRGYQQVDRHDEDSRINNISSKTSNGGSGKYTDDSSIVIPIDPFNKSNDVVVIAKKVGLALGIFIACIIAILSITSRASSAPLPFLGSDSEAMFDSLGRYILKDFDSIKPMSNFLAGLGGLWGLPMWAFYVNRGQGITAFGIQNKDGAIAKFNTAEKAYLQTPFSGFRTFVKGQRYNGKFTHMPFFINSNDKTTRNMAIGGSEMEIEEVESSIGLKTNVLYYTIADEDFPALIRKTSFTNLDAYMDLDLEVLDGLGKLIPSGLGNWVLDAMGRTMEAWMNVYNADGEEITQPFFHISQGTADTASVQIIKDGHFAVAYVESDDAIKLLPFVVDPSVVFNTDTTMSNPSGFFSPDSPSVEDIVKLPQGKTSRTPCSFAGTSLRIPAGGTVSIISIYGHADNLDDFLTKISPKITSKGFVNEKRVGAAAIVDRITDKVETVTSSPLFDAYVKQDFLDNTLRGGIPIVIGDNKIYHAFSRIHGDLERDYNNFQIDTTYFSQGPGNFRDVSQNRRLDVLLTPAVGDFNARMFLSFCQADGYNPLTVATTNFKVPSEKLTTLIASLELVEPDSNSLIHGGMGQTAAKVSSILSKPFRVGQLFADLKTAKVVSTLDRATFLDKVATAAIQVPAAQYAQNGFWADHWTYTLDLVENFLAIFPDKEQSFLWESTPVPFYMSPAIVKPRHNRYSLVDNPNKPGSSTVRVYSAVSAWGDADFPAERKTALNAIYSDSSYIADSSGAGGVWQRSKSGAVFTVAPITKLLMLGTLKFSALDPKGMGVEMEGGKPGWNDAMNGLPGLLGSGMPETYEMFRLIEKVRDTIVKHNKNVEVPKEFSQFLSSMDAALDSFDGSSKDDIADFSYWDASNNARETYRDAVVATFDGEKVTISSSQITAILNKMLAKTKAGIDRAVAFNNGLSPTYFYYECVDYEIIPPAPTVSGQAPPATQVKVKQFKLHTLPLFLEGPTRHMKIVDDVDEKRKVFEMTKNSALYDEPLKMFTISESLKSMGQDVGRMMAFTPGWLENQSVWLHMSYKFYLELLRGGLYSEFFEEIKTGLVPFMDNKVYGRNPLEAASFIVSSAFPDSKLHGASFLARLSGSTAEFLSMWAIMTSGEKPFEIDENGLVLALKPILPGWLFTEQGTVAFKFLGATTVTYHNPTRSDTWTVTPSRAVVVANDGTITNLDSPLIVGTLAQSVRDLKVATIDIFY